MSRHRLSWSAVAQERDPPTVITWISCLSAVALCERLSHRTENPNLFSLHLSVSVRYTKPSAFHGPELGRDAKGVEHAFRIRPTLPGLAEGGPMIHRDADDG